MLPSSMSNAAIERLIADKVAEAIATDRATRGDTRGPAGGNRGPTGSPAACEYSFARFMKWKESKVCCSHPSRSCLDLVEFSSCNFRLERANRTSWTEMRKLMTEEFCPREEVQRMEHELWNLKVKDYNIAAYTHHFNELALLCPWMVEPESVKVEAYIRGLSKNIKGDVTSSKPINLNEVVRMAHALMEQRV
ncbi:putative reverse transcriptase domain-containing protein [Tanacetum coccineum]